MTLKFDLAETENWADVIHQMVEALVDGGTARIDTHEGRRLFALATLPAAERVISAAGRLPTALMFADPEESRNVIQRLPKTAARLLRRSQSPMHVLIKSGHVDATNAITSSVEAVRSVDGSVRLSSPCGPVTRSLLRLLPDPVVTAYLPEGFETETALPTIEVTDSTRSAIPSLAVVDFDGDRWTLSEPGELTEKEVKAMSAEQVVFVCTGNTCRSPIAEALFRQLLAERLGCEVGELADRGYEIASAGLAAMSGSPASSESVEVCAEHGLDLRGHASQPLSESLLMNSDRMYTMTAGHRDAILARYPQLDSRVRMLSSQGRDVSDPIGWGQSAYDQCFAEIAGNLNDLVDELTTTN